MPLTDAELWACAHQVISKRGPDASRRVAAITAQLAAEGNIAGVRDWTDIGLRVAQLMDPRTGMPLSRQ
jgi:hypothetical protein